ncbi:hypothetical protein ACA910_003158 [Epithemia clementina (nom. ined.)]
MLRQKQHRLNYQRSALTSRGAPRTSIADRAVIGFFALLQVVIFLYFRGFVLGNDRHRDVLQLLSHDSAINRLYDSDKPTGKVPSSLLLTEDQEAAFEYVRSFRSFDRALKFVHIPKTAGTAVEQVAAEGRIAWGACLFYHKPKRKICPYPSGQLWPPSVGWWHVPSQFFPIARSNPYENAELFGIVRDPIERMVSEFYYSCTLKSKEWRPNHCDKARLNDAGYMNTWLSKKIDYEEVGHPALKYLMDNGHFVPQYEFLVGSLEVRQLDYVLLLHEDKESLHRDFRKLMKAFKLPLALKHMQSVASHGEADQNPSLTAANLTEATFSSLRKEYINDVELIQNLKNVLLTTEPKK